MKASDYHFYLDMGICPGCHKRTVAPGRSRCSVCLEKERERNARYRKRKLAEQEAKTGSPSAYKTPDTQLDAVRAYRERHKKAGLCICCGRKALPGLQLCEKHRRQALERNNWKEHHESHRPPREHLDAPTPRHKTKIDIGKLFALYNAGWTVTNIADELKTSESNVYKWISIARKEKEDAE